MRLLSAWHYVSPLSTVSDLVNQYNTRVYHCASSRIPLAAQRRLRPGWAAASECVGVGKRCCRPTVCTQQPSSSLCCAFHHPRKITQRPHLFFCTCWRTAMTYHYGIMLTISMHTAAQPSACCDSSQWTTGNTLDVCVWNKHTDLKCRQLMVQPPSCRWRRRAQTPGKCPVMLIT